MAKSNLKYTESQMRKMKVLMYQRGKDDGRRELLEEIRTLLQVPSSGEMSRAVDSLSHCSIF